MINKKCNLKCKKNNKILKWKGWLQSTNIFSTVNFFYQNKIYIIWDEKYIIIQ